MEEFNPDALSELFETAAVNIKKKVEDVLNDVPTYERSWIWELIQNAKDNVASDFPNQQVSINVDWTNKNYFKFSHNFGYFTRINVEGIIRQRNKKDENREEKQAEINSNAIIIGRFGTGFMTTHLLSRKVDVSALYLKGDKIYKLVKFPLDRTDLEKAPLIKSIKESFDCAQSSIEVAEPFSKDQIDFSEYNTCFEYELNVDSQKIVEKGIEDLSISLPFTFVFVDGIKQIKLNLQNEIVIFEKEAPIQIHENIYKVCILQKIGFYVIKKEYVYIRGNIPRLYNNKEHDIDIRLALEIETDELGNIYLNQFERSLPYIFLDFPLIGTEDFYFPTIINFPLFHPTEARDGIYLEKEGNNNKENQEVFLISILLFSDLLEYAQKSKWNNLYNLAKTKLPKEQLKFSESWFKDNVQSKLREILLKSQIVQTEKSRINLIDAIFPYHTSIDKVPKIWNLAKPLHIDKLPKFDHIEIWYDIIDEDWSTDLRIDIKKIVAEISNFKKVSDLSQRIETNNDMTLTWLNNLIEFVFEEDNKLLVDYSIIPNQYGELKKIDELWEDINIPNEIKTALKILSTDWCPLLKHTEIKSLTIPKSLGIIDGINKTNQIIKENRNEGVKKCVLYLLSCIPSSPELKDKRLKYFNFAKTFYKDTPEEQEIIFNESSAWEECEKWFMKKITYDISLFGNVISLSTHLEKSGFDWLHDFISFISSERYETHLNDYALLPNQKGDFKRKKELSVDKEIDEDLKDILEGLGEKCKELLLATEISLDIEGKELKSSDIATKIVDKVLQIYRNDLGRNRDENTKQLFAKLLLWMHYNDKNLATDFFGEVYDKRVLYLRTIEENIADIEFKQNILNNTNGYTEEEILKFISTPKTEQITLTIEEYNKLKASGISTSLPIKWDELKFNGEEEESNWKEIALFFMKTLGEIGIYDVQTYLFFIGKVKNKEILVRSDSQRNIPDAEFDIIGHKIQITSEAVAATIPFLENLDYKILEFNKEYPNIIRVRFKDNEFNLVIRPSHDRHYQLHVNERSILETKGSELWLSDGIIVQQETLNALLVRIFNSGTVFIPTQTFIPGTLIR